MSTVAGGLVYGQSATPGSAIAGITIVAGAGNAEGDGTLTYDYSESAKTLAWKPYGGYTGTAVTVPVDGDGTYSLWGSGSSGELVVTIDESELPASDGTITVTIANIANSIFDDISKVESNTGESEYRCLYLKNAGTVATVDLIDEIVLFIKTQTAGADSISIGLDPGGKNTAPTAVANEDTAPSGVTFTAPSSAASGLAVGALDATDYYPFWIKRTVPAATRTATAANTFVLEADGLF